MLVFLVIFLNLVQKIIKMKKAMGRMDQSEHAQTKVHSAHWWPFKNLAVYFQQFFQPSYFRPTVIQSSLQRGRIFDF